MSPGTCTSGTHPRSSCEGGKSVAPVVASALRSSRPFASTGSSPETRMPSTRRAGPDGSRSASACSRPPPRTPHGSPASGSTTTRCPPRSIHRRSAFACSAPSSCGPPARQTIASRLESPSQRSGSSDTRPLEATRVSSCMAGTRSPSSVASSVSSPIRSSPSTASAPCVRPTGTERSVVSEGRKAAWASSLTRIPSRISNSRSVNTWSSIDSARGVGCVRP